MLFLATPRLLSEPETAESLHRENNERIIDTLPRYPGAIEVERRTRPTHTSRGLKIRTGWETVVTYSLPRAGRPRPVIDFYVRVLPSWDAERGRAGAIFKRGTRLVVLDVTDVRQREFQFVVDYVGNTPDR